MNVEDKRTVAIWLSGHDKKVSTFYRVFLEAIDEPDLALKDQLLRSLAKDTQHWLEGIRLTVEHLNLEIKRARELECLKSSKKE